MSYTSSIFKKKKKPPFFFFAEIDGPKTFLRIGSYYKTTIDKLKIMNHLKLLTKYN